MAEQIPVTPQMYQRLTAKIAGKPEERILSYLMLRSLKQARNQAGPDQAQDGSRERAVAAAAHHHHLGLFGQAHQGGDGGREEYLVVDTGRTGALRAFFSDLDCIVEEFLSLLVLPLPDVRRHRGLRPGRYGGVDDMDEG